MADYTVKADVDTFIRSNNQAEMRTNIGAGTIATQNANNVSITGGSVTGITDLAIADGGTGAGTAAGARTNLEVYSDAEVDAKVATKETAGGVQMSVISNGGRIDTGITGVASYLLGGVYTYSFWFKDEKPGSSSLLLGSESWSVSGLAVYIHGSTNQLRFQLTGYFSNNLILNLGTTYRDGKWRQLTFTSDWSSNDGTVAPITSFYIDGQSVSPQTVTSYNGTYDYVGNSGIEKLWIGNLPGNNSGCSSGIRGFRVFNRALSAPEVADLYESGTVAVADRWGNPEYYPNYTASDYLDGTIFNISVYPTLVTGLSDPDSGTNAFSLENPDTTQRRFGTDANEVISTKQKVALSFWARVPSGTYNLSVLFRDNPFTSVVAHTAALTTSWQKFTFTDSSVRANAGFYFDFTTAVTVEIYDLKFYSVGCIADLPLDEGIGYQFHDRSSNHFDALASTTGVTHLVPKTDGYIRDFNVDAYNGGTGAFIVTSAQQMLPDNAMWSDLLIEDNIGGTNFSGSAFYVNDGTTGSNVLICSPGGVTGAGSKVLSVPPSNVAITPSRNRLFFKVTDSTPNPGSLNIRAEYKQI